MLAVSLKIICTCAQSYFAFKNIHTIPSAIEIHICSAQVQFDAHCKLYTIRLIFVIPVTVVLRSDFKYG